MGPMAAIALPPQMAVPAVIRNEEFPRTRSNFPRARPPHERKGNSAQRGIDEAAAAGFQNFVQIHAEARALPPHTWRRILADVRAASGVGMRKH